MKSLACWIGRHKWELRTDHGDEFTVCALCGKVPGDAATPTRPLKRHSGRPTSGRLQEARRRGRRVVMAKKLRCWVAWHRWVRHVNDQGEAYFRCADCEKFKDIRREGGVDWPNSSGGPG
jgi:hypothetical protein